MNQFFFLCLVYVSLFSNTFNPTFLKIVVFISLKLLSVLGYRIAHIMYSIFVTITYNYYTLT